MSDFHFLRSLWLLAIIPLLGLALLLWRQRPALQAWNEVCDPHLLAHLEQKKGRDPSLASRMFLFFSLFFMIISLAGPTFFKFPVATYKPVQARVLVLDMSENMMQEDLSPNRLSRAKFKLHDLFARKGIGQFGMVVFTGEPFVVSPLTDDGQTIAALLASLTPEVMPVSGHQLESALQEAKQVILRAGYSQGQILLLTADPPSLEAIELAKKMAGKGIYSSIMPVRADKDLNPLFQQFADAGLGQLLRYSADSRDWDRWINKGNQAQQVVLNKEDDLPLWRDEGRWFLIPALLLLLPVFRRGWLQKVAL